MTFTAKPDENMRMLMLRALGEQPEEHVRPVVKLVAGLLAGAMEGIREGGRDDAVLELRPGLEADLGDKYTAVLRNERNTFQHNLFSIYDGATVAFQADGKTQAGLTDQEVRELVTAYLVKTENVRFILGLLDQFRPRVVEFRVPSGEVSVQNGTPTVSTDPTSPK